ncbi:MAG: hypothetical protein HOW97_42785 [Catenulispora sp.]|nr:hypothetical protein [Catenulispora sp.]
MSWLPPVGATTASGALAWVFCLRPMLRHDDGACCPPAPEAAGSGTAEQIRQLRAEVEQLRAARDGDDVDARRDRSSRASLGDRTAA